MIINQSGIAHVAIILVVIIISIGFIGFKVGIRSDKSATNAVAKQAIVSTAAPASTTAKTQAKVAIIDPFTQPQTIGDGKVSTSVPRKGYVYSCSTGSSGGGATKDGNWVSGTQYDPAKKLHVQGDVAWSAARVSITTSSAIRTISSNDLPDHQTGTFPIASTDPAYVYDRNPNSIVPQTESFSLPVTPSAQASPSCLAGGAIGIMANGVLLFDALDAQNRDAVAHEVQDSCAGHPEKQGSYHYHGYSPCFKSASAKTVIGYALDGYGVTGPKKDDGNYYATADLDTCHGTTSTITWDAKSVSMYHYVMTADYPYSIGCYHGKTSQTASVGAAPTSTAPNSGPSSAALPSQVPTTTTTPPTNAPKLGAQPSGPPPPPRR